MKFKSITVSASGLTIAGFYLFLAALSLYESASCTGEEDCFTAAGYLGGPVLAIAREAVGGLIHVFGGRQVFDPFASNPLSTSILFLVYFLNASVLYFLFAILSRAIRSLFSRPNS